MRAVLFTFNLLKSHELTVESFQASCAETVSKYLRLSPFAPTPCRTLWRPLRACLTHILDDELSHALAHALCDVRDGLLELQGCRSQLCFSHSH